LCIQRNSSIAQSTANDAPALVEGLSAALAQPLGTSLVTAWSLGRINVSVGINQY
jgi:hypothetical protein